MDNVDISKLKRDKDKINKLITNKDNKLITQTDLYIVIPNKFIERGISSIGNTVNTVGVFAIVDPISNSYSVSLIPTKVDITPLEISNIVVNEESYVVLKIEKGMPLLSSNIVIKDKSLAYELFDIFYVHAKIPWFLSYTDIHKVFGNIEKYTGSKSGKFVLIFELLTSLIAKDNKDVTIFFRNSLKNELDVYNKPVVYRGLKDLFTTVTSNLNKIVGSYFKDSILSSMNNKATETSRLEDIIRD